MEILLFRKLQGVFLILLSAVMLSTSGFALIPTATSQFFVQNSKSGSCKRIAGDPLRYTIKFKDVSSDIVFFSNQPTNAAKFVTIKNFIKVWNNNKATGVFQNNANGVLTLSHGEFKGTFIFNVENIVYNKKKNKMTYTVKLIPITSELVSKNHHLKARQKLPKKFDEASLVIDNPSGSSDLLGNSWDSLGG